jgi:hypothetical protein
MPVGVGAFRCARNMDQPKKPFMDYLLYGN